MHLIKHTHSKGKNKNDNKRGVRKCVGERERGGSVLNSWNVAFNGKKEKENNLPLSLSLWNLSILALILTDRVTQSMRGFYLFKSTKRAHEQKKFSKHFLSHIDIPPFIQISTETSWRTFFFWEKMDRANKKNGQANVWAHFKLILQILFLETFLVDIHSTKLLIIVNLYLPDIRVWSLYHHFSSVTFSYIAASNFNILSLDRAKKQMTRIWLHDSLSLPIELPWHNYKVE